MKAEDILNNTDPQELRNLIWRLRRMLDGSQRPPPTTIVIQAPGQYPPLLPTLGPNRVVITNGAGTITSDESLEYIQDGYVPGTQIATASVDGTSATGVQITGLTIGDWYAIEGTGGPFHMHTSIPPFNGDYYNFELSLDGITFSGQIGYNNTDGLMHLTLPSFGAYAEAVDSNYGRVYFQATTTSVWFRTVDGTWSDNTGSLGYKLLNATSGGKQITLDDVEYTKAKLAGAIHSAGEKTTPVNADEFGIWDSVTGLLKKVTWSNIKATLKTYFDTLYAPLATYLTDAPSDGSQYARKDGAWDVVEASGAGHEHALTRWVSDGGTTFEFPDYVQTLESVMLDGTEKDATLYSLSIDGSQLVFDSAVTAAVVIQAHYIPAAI